MDAVENVGQIGLRIEAVDLCGLDDRHGAGQGFGPGISTGEEPVFPADANWAQCQLGGIVVDGDTTVGQEQAEGLSTTQSISEAFGQIAFAWNAQELLFGPGKEGRYLWRAQLLTRSMADVSGLTVDTTFGVVELADPVERLSGDLGFG